MQINPAEISELIKSKIQNLQVAAEKRTRRGGAATVLELMTQQGTASLFI